MAKKIGTTFPASKVKTNTGKKPSSRAGGNKRGSGGNRSVNGTPRRG